MIELLLQLAPLFFMCALVIGFTLGIAIRKELKQAWVRHKAEQNQEPEPPYYIPASCKGEHCYCGQPAEHKIEEVIFSDDPSNVPIIIGDHMMPSVAMRHPLTRYVCHQHFVEIMGPLAKRIGE